MNLPLWFGDLLFWGAQVAVLALAAAILVKTLRMREPRALLVCWRTLIGASLLLPFVEPWQRPEIPAASSVAPDFSFSAIVPAASAASPHWHFPSWAVIAEILGAVIVAGIAVRSVMLALGLVKLRQLRRKSCAIAASDECAAIIEETRVLVGGRAEFRLSREVESPVTFGFAAPVVLLPEKFRQLGERFQAAIACHELLHVRRRDWAHHLGEEVLRAIFWFHPAILWLVARVRLAREQVVDLEVVRLTAARKTYVEALLAFTSGRRAGAIPAPLFLAEQQLVERVALMLKEAGMSRRRLIASLSVIGCGLAGAAVLAVMVFPLKAEPRAAAGVQETLTAFHGAVPILRSVAVKYRGFDDATLNDTTAQEQKEYLEKFLKDPPSVETPYDQKKADEMAKLIESFWKEKGVEVEVSSTLTPIPNTKHVTYARLLFNVQDTQGGPLGSGLGVIDAKSIWTDTVKQGTMDVDVRGLGTLALLNGRPVAKIELAETQAGGVHPGQSAEVDTHKGIINGRVADVSPEVINGTRSTIIVLGSAVPSGLDAHASVEGTIQVAKLETVVYVGRPVMAKANSQGRLFKIIDNGKEAEQVRVEYGRVSVSAVQVLSGLKPGDTVILAYKTPDDPQGFTGMSSYEVFNRLEIKQ